MRQVTGKYFGMVRFISSPAEVRRVHPSPSVCSQTFRRAALCASIQGRGIGFVRKTLTSARRPGRR